MSELKTHCRNGHEYTPKNTYTTPSGQRRCRTCHRECMNRNTRGTTLRGEIVQLKEKVKRRDDLIATLRAELDRVRGIAA